MAATKSKKSAAKVKHPLKHPQRRGIVLLVIISILVLFMLMLVTFAVVSSHYRQAAQSNAQRNYFQDDYHQEVDQVFEQILVGPRHPYSSLYGTDLLGDLYGNDGVSGQVSYVIENLNTSTTNSPFIGLRVSSNIVANASSVSPHPDQANPVNQQLNTAPFGRTFSTIDDYYAGNVITMTSGACRGLSSRITHYRPNAVAGVTSANVQLRMEPFISDEGILLVPSVGDLFLINGKPFNGTGLGQPNYVDNTNTRRIKNLYANDDVAQFNRTTGQFEPITPSNPLAPGASTFPISLMPHLAGYGNVQLTFNAINGGQDEPWDTFDYQNPFLALVPADPQSALITTFPSYHRPDLKQYWFNFIVANYLGSVTNVNDQLTVFNFPFGPDNLPNTPDDSGSPWSSVSIADRQIIVRIRLATEFRPISANHPNFATPLNSYDVDNDGDGRVDSIWIDPGLPVIHAPNGRPYKRLAAIMIRDLDGRINVNAHGSSEFLERDHRPEYDFMTTATKPPLPGVQTTPPQLTSLKLPRGAGYGPAEIQFMNLFLDHDLNGTGTNAPTNLAVAEQMYREIMQGTNTGIPGRCGIDGDAANPQYRRPGFVGPLAPAAGATSMGTNPPSNDALANIKTQGFPLDYTDVNPAHMSSPSGMARLGIYNSPPDVWGRGAYALDIAGFAYPFHLGERVDWNSSILPTPPPPSETLEISDNPYEINLLDTGANDSPYTVAELERVLRRYDYDAHNLPTRLFDRLDLGGNRSAYTSRQRYDNAGTPQAPMRTANLRASLVTTMSSYVPTPRGALPKYMRLLPSGDPFANPGTKRWPDDKNYSPQLYDTSLNNGTFNQPPNSTPAPAGNSILDAARARVLNATWNYSAGPPSSALTEAQVSDVLEAIMPFELFRGEMFNLNRPFGNGVDDSAVGQPGYGVVDEPGEVETNAWTQGPFASATVGTNPENDDPIYIKYNATYKDPRQLYARHLYCLLRLICDPAHLGTLNLTQAGSPPTLQQEIYYRRLAQYAVNVVDYRDSDAIMTPFEYDINPFDGWVTDGNLGTDENDDTYMNANRPTPNGMVAGSQRKQRRIVWGMENPDLLISETLAFHNTRVRDTDLDNNTGTKRLVNNKFSDKTVDQFGIPEGSLFFEFKSTRPLSVDNPRFPAELYVNDPNLGTRHLWLSKTAPPRSFNGITAAAAGHPVWRAVVAKPNNPDLFATASGAPETMTFEPHDDTLINTTNVGSPIYPNNLSATTERIIWFTPQSPFDLSQNPPTPRYPEATVDTQTIFYGQSNEVYLQPGEYAVAGPRADTAISSITTDMDPNTFEPNQNRLRLPMATTPAATGFTYPPASYAGLIKNTPANNTPRFMICAADPPKADAAQWAGRKIGMNISEPHPNRNYYPVPTNGNYYGDLNTPANKTVHDKPFDSDKVAYPSPVSQDTVYGRQTGTRTNFRSLFLQRLANPTLPWNPMPSDPIYGSYYLANLQVNPYLTVDWSPLDLTVYTGEEDVGRQITDTMTTPGAPITEWLDNNTVVNGDNKGDEDPFNPGNEPRERFTSRERGNSALITYTAPNVAPTHQLNSAFKYDDSIWSCRWTAPVQTKKSTGASSHFFEQELDIQPPSTQKIRDTNAANKNDFWHTLGYLNFSMGMPLSPAPTGAYLPYLGSTQDPSPLVKWNDSPFSNPHDLLLVPFSSNSRFCWEVSYYDKNLNTYKDRPTVTNPYDASNPAPTGIENKIAYFSYLINPFLGNVFPHTGGTAGQDTVTPGGAPDLARLFDVVETPSPFVGTERWYYPTTTYDPPHAVGTPSPQPWGERFRPPFNRLSRFRDPGRINLNTITEPEVWDALVATYPELVFYQAVVTGTPITVNGWNALVDSRRTIPGAASNTSGDMFQNVNSSPTFFPNPFRPADAFDLMPLPNLKLLRPVDATLLRSDPNTPNRPMWDRPHNMPAPVSPLTTPPSDDYRNTDRNAMFKYQPFSKLPNLVSTNSNAYAVWITIGYFEVEQGAIDAAHPDGYRLGQEMGLDDGTAKRHRAFYLLDRSIPVAYEPGKMNNADRCVLLKRYIE